MIHKSISLPESAHDGRTFQNRLGRLVKCGAATIVFQWFFNTGIPVFAQERVLGTDISYWNCGTSTTGISQTNWGTAYHTGNMRFVFHRASRGGTTGVDQPQGTPGGGSLSTLSRRYDDPRFIQNLNRSTTAGIFSGSYHFGRPDIIASTPDTGGIPNNGTDEANHFIEMAGAWMRPGYLLPVFDLEAGQSQRTANDLAQFCIDFSDRIYAVMQIRPGMYINGTYSGTLQSATQARRDALAKPPEFMPSAIGPAYPMLWDARYSDNNNPTTIPIQTGNPKSTYTTVSSFYGPWDDYGDLSPWAIWQYASTVSIAGLNAVDSTVDANVSQGDLEYIKNFLVPAIWWNDGSGDWSNFTNWNSGQTPVAPISSPGQATPYSTGPLPTPRLPGASGSGAASGQHDTVILERPNANISVTLSTGTHNVRKLYMRESLNITGGSLTVNYNPTYRANDSALVLHGGPVSAQFSGPVTLGGGSLNVHTLQVDTNRIFTLGGGTLTFDKINLMPHGTTPAKILMAGNVNLNPLSNAMANIAKGAGTGSSGSIDLGGADRTFTVGNGTNLIDLAIDVPISNGALTKAGLGTMRTTIANTYAGGTTISAGTLLVNNITGSGTGTGPVTVNVGILGGIAMISGALTVNSAGTISPGAAPGMIGTLTLLSSPTLIGTNFMEINRNNGSSLSDRILRSGGALNYGGTLVVSNIGATLIGGEVFTNFTANSFSGEFANTILPPLNSGLNWYLGGLITNGTIKVNRRPVANPVTLTNDAPAVLQIPIASLIANDTDQDGDVLSVASISLTTTNGISLLTNNTFIFYSNYVSVADRFDYTVTDNRGGSATGMVHIAANPAGRFAGLPTDNGNSVTLHFVGSPGWTYYVERSTNLPVWLTISTNVAPPSGLFDYMDDFQGMTESPASAFYRLRWQP